MLAGRLLPPIVRPSSSRPSSPTPQSPVATFFNVPRRYVRSSMQVGDTSPTSSTDDVKRSRSLRKSNRIHDSKSGPTSSPLQRTKGEKLPSPAADSPRSTKKRSTHLEETINGDESETTSPTEMRSPHSAMSKGSGEPSPHVCLCQPEPKIPRPRNGE